MALTFRTNPTQRIQATVRKTNLSTAKLEQLGDVDVAGLEDGYTLVYDADLDKWVSQPITAAPATNIDGGTF